MEQNTPTYPNIIQSLDKLKLLVFWEILKSQNPKLLDVDYIENKNYSHEEEEYIYYTWSKLWDNYFQLKNDGKSKLVLQNSYKQIFKAYTISSLCSNISMLLHLDSVSNILPEEDFLNNKQMLVSLFKVIEPKIRVNSSDDIPKIVLRVKRAVESLQNQYKIDQQRNEKEVVKQIDNVFTVITRVSATLGMQLNAQKMVVSEWLAYEAQAKEIHKQREESKRNKKNKR